MTALDAAGILVRVDSREKKLIVSWSQCMTLSPFQQGYLVCLLSKPTASDDLALIPMITPL